MNTNDCPFCGTLNSLEKNKRIFTAKYAGETTNTEIEYYKCKNCEEEFFLDLEEESEKKMNKACELARKNSVTNVLSKLDDDSSFVTIERCFGLPPRTLSKWKNQSKNPSATAAAFVNLLGVFPWLTKIAFCNYDSNKAHTIAAYELLQKALENPYVTANFESNDIFRSITIKNISNTYTDNKYANINNLVIQGGFYDYK